MVIFPLMLSAVFMFCKAQNECSIPVAERKDCGDSNSDYSSCVARALCCYDHVTFTCYMKRVSPGVIQAEYYQSLTYLQRVPQPPNFSPILNAARTANLGPSHVSSSIQQRALSFQFSSAAQTQFPSCSINIPICYRTKCGEQYPNSEEDPNQCFLDPKCCFDKNIFLYKFMFGSTFMGGVPTCYHGPTSSLYLQLANEILPWNPYFQTAIIEIISESLLETLPFRCLFNSIFPTSASSSTNPICGWKGISRKECGLRDCCFDADTGTCTYPSSQFNQFLSGGIYNHPELKTNSQEEAQCQYQNRFSSQMYQRLPCLLLEEGDDPTMHILRCPQSRCCRDYGAVFPHPIGMGAPASNPFLLFGQSPITSGNNSFLANPFLLGALASQTNHPFLSSTPFQHCPFTFNAIPGLPDISPSLAGCCTRHACYHKKKYQNLQPPIQPIGETPRQPFINTPLLQQPYGHIPPTQQPYATYRTTELPNTNNILSRQPLVNTGLAGSNNWRAWSQWTACSSTCGLGSRNRFRTCSRSDNQCFGEHQQMEDCYISNYCPITPSPSVVWGQWSDWSDCSVTCGIGAQTKHRRCVIQSNGLQAPDPSSCGAGDEIIASACSKNLCASWGAWSNFTACTASCTTSAVQKRTRNCLANGRKVNFTLCIGSPQSRKVCRLTKCIRIGEWQEWESCSETCGEGTRRRFRSCFNDTIQVNSPCNYKILQTRSCSQSACPVEVLRWGEWGEWGACSTSCGSGLKARSRRCVLVAFNQTLESSVCTSLIGASQEQGDVCKLRSCYHWSSWSSYAPCSVSCGNGTQAAQRNCLKDNNQVNSGNCLGPSTRERPCQGPTCNPDVIWKPWSECTATCGSGQQLRFRCVPQHDGKCIVTTIEFFRRECEDIPSC